MKEIFFETLKENLGPDRALFPSWPHVAKNLETALLQVETLLSLTLFYLNASYMWKALQSPAI